MGEELTTSGLYSRTRIPLYFGSALLAAGFCVAGHSWIAGALVAVYFVAFYYAVMRNEEQELGSRWGATFEQYAARVPLFLPWMFSEAAPPEGAEAPRRFSWAQYWRNREYRALIGTIGALALVWVRMWLPAAGTLLRR